MHSLQHRIWLTDQARVRVLGPGLVRALATCSSRVRIVAGPRGAGSPCRGWLHAVQRRPAGAGQRQPGRLAAWRDDCADRSLITGTCILGIPPWLASVPAGNPALAENPRHRPGLGRAGRVTGLGRAGRVNRERRGVMSHSARPSHALSEQAAVVVGPARQFTKAGKDGTMNVWKVVLAALPCCWPRCWCPPQPMRLPPRRPAGASPQPSRSPASATRTATRVVGGAGVPLYLAGWLLIPEEGSGQSIASRFIQPRQARSH